MALQIRRGLESDRSGITPLAGEILMTTDTKQFFIGDGSFPGGHKVGGIGSSFLFAEAANQQANPTLGWTAQPVVKQLASVRNWAGTQDNHGFNIPATKSIIQKHNLMGGYIPHSALQDGGYIDIHISGTYSPKSSNPGLLFRVVLKNPQTGEEINLTAGGPTGAAIGWGFTNTTSGSFIKRFPPHTRFTMDMRIRSLGRYAYLNGNGDSLKIQGSIKIGDPIRYDGLNIGAYSINGSSTATGNDWTSAINVPAGPTGEVYQSGFIAEHHREQYRCIAKHLVTGNPIKYEPGAGFDWRFFWRRSDERILINDTYSVDLVPAYEIKVQMGGCVDERRTRGPEAYDRCVIEGGDILLVGSFGGLEWTP